MLVTRHNFHWMPKRFNESSLVRGVEALAPSILKSPSQEHMLKCLWGLDAPQMVTRHRGFDIPCGGDALEGIFQRHCSDSSPVSASIVERLLEETLGRKRTHAIMHVDESNSFGISLQS